MISLFVTNVLAAISAKLGKKPFKGPLEKLPTNRAEVYELFGNPGDKTLDPAWERKNILNKVMIPGVPNKTRLHRLAQPYVLEAFKRAQAAAPDHKIILVGGFNYRHQRHDTDLPLSYHSWGIAVDVNPAQNAGKYAKDFPGGKIPKPFSKEWREAYPEGLPEEFVRAFCSVGFSWGGDWKSFCDPMHFELVL